MLDRIPIWNRMSSGATEGKVIACTVLAIAGLLIWASVPRTEADRLDKTVDQMQQKMKECRRIYGRNGDDYNNCIGEDGRTIEKGVQDISEALVICKHIGGNDIPNCVGETLKRLEELPTKSVETFACLLKYRDARNYQDCIKQTIEQKAIDQTQREVPQSEIPKNGFLTCRRTYGTMGDDDFNNCVLGTIPLEKQ